MSAGFARERRRGERRRLDEERFWRALRVERRTGERRRGPELAAVPAALEPARPSTVEPTAAGTDTNPSQEARRAALLSLLEAAEARSDRARAPVLAGGVRVRVSHGALAGRAALVLDADYIESRVLLELGPDEPPCWVPFTRVAATAEDEGEGGAGTSED